MTLSRLLATAVLSVAVCTWVQADESADFDTIRQRLIDHEMRDAADVSAEDVASYIASMNDDGSWPDVDYDDTTVTMWRPRVALTRLGRMAVLYNLPSSPYYRNDELRGKFLLGMEYWFTRDPQSANSWWNQIGGQQYIEGPLVIMRDQLGPDLLPKAVEYLARGDIRQSSYSRSRADYADLADITIARGVVEGSPETLKASFDSLASTLVLAAGDGVKCDYSFHQHRRILYNGGYGLEFCQQAARLAALPEGTSFALQPARKEFLASYMLDGQQWMMRGIMDFSTQGRGVSRQGSRDPARMVAAMASVCSLNTSRQYELHRMADRIRAGWNDPDNYLRGNRAFFCSDFMTHHRKDWYASVHMTSTRTRGTESGNGEGLKNYYMGDGVNFITTGMFEEYQGVFGVWNWRRLPGATIEQQTGDLPQPTWGRRAGGGSGFVGGVSDGNYGMCTMTLGRDDLAANKSWFFFDREFVALGAGIEAPQAAPPVFTTLNQSLANGAVTVRDREGNRRIPAGGTADLAGAEWAHHDRTGYVFLDRPGKAGVSNTSLSGNWHDINVSNANREVSADVFCLWVDHGPQPAGGQYAYLVAPGIGGVEDIEAYASSLPVAVLRNDEAVQAVRHGGLKITQAAFRHAGPLEVAAGLTVTPDRSVLVMVHERGFGLQVSVADPAGDRESETPVTVNVEVTGALSGAGCSAGSTDGTSRLEFRFPTLEHAGQTVTGVYDNLFTGPRAAAYVPSGDTAVLYDMDDSPGSITIADRSGNGIDLLGGVSVFADDAGPRGLRAAASFAPVEGAAAKLPMRVLSAAESAKFSVGCFTLEAWLKVSGNQPRAGIFELGKARAGKIQFGMDDGRLMLKASGLNFAGPIATDKLEWSPDQWYHVAVLVDAGDPSTPEDAVTVRFYRTPAGQADGRRVRLVCELAGTGTPEAVAPGACMVLGDLDGSDACTMAGTMDEVRFTNRALGPEEFNLVAPPPERPATTASQP